MVYAQHKMFFNQNCDAKCPREDFVRALCQEITMFKQEGNHLLLMLDSNEDMGKGAWHSHLSSCQLRETILKSICRMPFHF
jgi:hypothetical protein